MTSCTLNLDTEIIFTAIGYLVIPALNTRFVKGAVTQSGRHFSMNTAKTFLKLQYEGSWWKISLLCELAKLLGLHTVFFSGGTL